MIDSENHIAESPAQRYLALCAEVAERCRACGRNPDEITIVAVSKNAAAAAASEVVRAGAGDLGENRVQELIAKQTVLESEGLSPRWHLIGSLQTNKVRQVVGRTALIHSVDRIGLAEEIGRCSVRSGMTTPVLLQFNLSHEESKHGFDESEAERALDACSRIPGICMEGLMTMAPLAGGSSAAAQAFDTARRLFERLRDSGVADPDVFCRLSMGMSGDFPEAIRAGATIIRVGSAVFGVRHPL